MAISMSTGLRDYLAATGSLKGAMDGGVLKIYSGTPPASANDAATGTLLVTISLNSTATGLTLEAVPGTGRIQKPTGDIWSGTIAASGVAGYFRHVTSSDTGVLSSTERRIQGAVGVAASDILLNNTSLSALAVQAIDYYVIQLPS